MTSMKAIRLLVLGSLLGFSIATSAQEDSTTPDAESTVETDAAVSTAMAQADVWATIEATWNNAAKNSDRWIDDYLADDFAGWSNTSPAPRNKTSIRMWDRFERTQGRVVAHELYPLSIIVRGDTAIAHYLYSSAFEDKDGDVEVGNGRYTDILIREDDGWKFIAWHGGND